MNILLVVPFYDNLPLLSSEAETIVNLLKPRRVLQGNVTEDRLRSTIQDEVSNGPFDGIWFATHSSERELELSDGAIPREALVQYIAMAGAQWVAINGCESEGLAAGIAAIGIDVLAVAMTADGHGIEDRDAWRAAILLASALRDTGGDLKAAFESVPNLSTHHRFFPAAANMRAYSGDRNLEVAIARLEEKVDNMSARMNEMATRTQVIGMGAGVLVLVALIFYLFQRGII